MGATSDTGCGIGNAICSIAPLHRIWPQPSPAIWTGELRRSVGKAPVLKTQLGVTATSPSADTSDRLRIPPNQRFHAPLFPSSLGGSVRPDTTSLATEPGRERER